MDHIQCHYNLSCDRLRSLLSKEINQIKQEKEDQDFEEYYISYQIRIKDSGAGISKENIGKLFLNFGKLADTKGVNK